MVVRELITLLGFKLNNQNLKKYENEVENAKKSTGGLSKSMGGMGNVLKFGAIAAAAGVGFLGAKIVDLTGDLEQNQIAFEVMLGSADAAKKMVQDLRNMGAATPYESKDLIQAAKTMMQFGVASQDVMGDLSMLGDVGAGDAQRLQSLALVFGQIHAAGKLQGGDLLQLVNAGFNPLQTISEKTGQSMASLRQQMEKGAISSDMVTQAFKDATSAGGRFYGMMDKQSRTLKGLLSTVADNIGMTLTGAGEKVLPMMKDLVTAFMNWSSANQDIIQGGLAEFLKGLMTFLGYIWVIMEEIVAKMGGAKAAGDKLGKAFSTIFEAVLKIIRPLIPLFVDLAAAVMNLIGPVADMLAPLFSFIGKIIGGIADWLRWFLPYLMTGIKQVLYVFQSLFYTIDVGFQAIIDGVKFVAGWLVTAFQIVSEIVTNVWNAIPGFFEGIWKGILEGATFLWEMMKSGFQAVVDWLVNLWNGFLSFFNGIWSTIQNAINSVSSFLGMGNAAGTPTTSGPRPPAASLAGGTASSRAGLPPAGIVSSQSFQTSVQVTVPPGTSEQQSAYLKDAAKKAVDESWAARMRTGGANFAPAEAGRGR